ncbi:hypothetical protein [Novosphingobium percolationis]|uniref:hypothetical protein n=1 Tax=Novosphingobium percolationis TaxID=2871811 RepID=UPI001CD2EBDE|nr:hypothetical protein [Novosphingobium percolationis]
MNTDLDELLSRLRTDAVHPGLAGLEGAVLRRIAARPQVSTGQQLRLGMVAAFGAVLLGVASNSLTTPAEASITLSPFGPSNPLAPSTLLAGPR